ncbi:MAG: DUF805 domain-containing protein [Hyphobacterium sp.]|nr:MAG: DUF805 domain-containing protein [Hyphobacterium sp.]
MNLGHVLFSPNGRIGQQEYWIGILILVGSNVFLTWIPLLGILIWAALIYMGICIYGKRLHDIGKSAWIHGLVWAIQLAIGMVGFAMAGGAIMAALASGSGEQAGLAAVMGASGSLFLIGGLGFLIWIVYTIWLGVAAAEAGENRFGPVAGSQAEPAPVAAPVPTVEPASDPAETKPPS